MRVKVVEEVLQVAVIAESIVETVITYEEHHFFPFFFYVFGGGGGVGVGGLFVDFLKYISYTNMTFTKNQQKSQQKNPNKAIQITVVCVIK